MKIYTNKNYEVLSLDVQPDQYVYEIETDKTREEIFGTWCIECIRKYRYEPTYEFLLDRNGNIVLNEAGDPIYKTVGHGILLLAISAYNRFRKKIRFSHKLMILPASWQT